MTVTGRNPRPPRRVPRAWLGPAGTWTYDVWGDTGRPVVLLHGPVYDRRMWWPAGAELADHATVIAVDLPGHGDSPARSGYPPAALVAELASLVDGVGRGQAPVVVGHSIGALLACVLAAHIRVHAVVTVAQSLDVRPLAGALRETGNLRGVLPQARLDALPGAYRDLVVPHPDAGLLADYLEWMTDREPHEVQQVVDDALRRIDTPHLTVLGDPPEPGYLMWLHRLVPTSQCRIYPHTGLFPHLHESTRFAAEVRALL
ncbi:alpha/beta fold hydrolase [Phytohabitans kaempferiae]|uniref:Alpha/beta fold hydrolase n=1 Tax=Phytohabitans kaempferiae TaxID=1620943 RepID=A0ABV6M1R3_9ACTN